MSIAYNRLNLPDEVSKGGDRLTYTYTAEGEKRAKEMSGQAQYYRGSMVYHVDGTPDYLLTPVGMARYTSSGWEYQYNLTDHLGNVRAVLNEKGGVEQETDYYPFGLAHSVNNLNKNSYLHYVHEVLKPSGTRLGIFNHGYSITIHALDDSK